MSIHIRRSPATSKHIADMLRRVNGFIEQVALVTISKKTTLAYTDTGLCMDIDQSDEAAAPEELVSELLKLCREHAVEHGDGWYQATFSTEEKETKQKGKVTRARATLDVIAFPIGDAEDATATRSSAKAAVESETAQVIRSMGTYQENVISKLGEQLVAVFAGCAGMLQSMVEVSKQIGAQQKGYITQGDTLVQLVKEQHAFALAMAEAESSEKHTSEILSFAEKFGMAWAKANLFSKPGKGKDGKEGYKVDTNLCDSANIMGSVLHDLSDEKKKELIELVGQDVFDLWVGASRAATQEECTAILLKMRELWAGKDLSPILQQLPIILGPENAAKLYAVFKESDVSE